LISPVEDISRPGIAHTDGLSAGTDFCPQIEIFALKVKNAAGNHDV